MKFFLFGEKLCDIVGIYPIPQKYFITHNNLGAWQNEEWEKLIIPTLATEEIRLKYN